MASLAAHGPAASARESLARNKEMVLAAMKYKGHSAQFKRFCKSETMDAFLHACIDYFGVYFEARKIEEDEAAAAEKRRDALAAGEKPFDGTGPGASSLQASVSTGRSKELHEKDLEQRARLRDIALVYATILLKHSNYANTQQERQFFESLYDFSKRVLFTINNRKHWHAIENELDRVFRSPHFNLSQRKNQANSQGNSAMTSFKEMYEKQGGAEGFARMGSTSSYRSSSIHKALLMRSPIISEIFPTAKDRAERAAELQQSLAELQQAEAEADGGAAFDEAGLYGATMRSSMRSSGRATSAVASPPAAAPLPLDGEEGMEELVQKVARDYNDTVG